MRRGPLSGAATAYYPGIVEPTLYYNDEEDTLRPELKDAENVGVVPVEPGTPAFDELILDREHLKYAVDENGILRFVPAVKYGVEITHPVIFQGRPVLVAGEAIIVKFGTGYVVTELNNGSGHYGPRGESLIDAVEAFRKANLTVPTHIPQFYDWGLPQKN